MADEVTFGDLSKEQQVEIQSQVLERIYVPRVIKARLEAIAKMKETLGSETWKGSEF